MRLGRLSQSQRLPQLAVDNRGQELSGHPAVHQRQPTDRDEFQSLDPKWASLENPFETANRYLVQPSLNFTELPSSIGLELGANE